MHGMIMGLEAFSADRVKDTGHITAVSLRQLNQRPNHISPPPLPTCVAPTCQTTIPPRARAPEAGAACEPSETSLGFPRNLARRPFKPHDGG